ACADVAGALKPILPGIGERIEQYLGVTLVAGARTSLAGRTLSPYQPLFTRIDPKRIDAMTEASRDSMQPTNQTADARPGAAAAADKAPPPAADKGPATITIDDFARLDLRIGKVVECGFVEGSDKLLRFLLD